MTVISGKDAYVNGVPCTTMWGASHAAGLQRYAASCTGGGTGVVEGNENWQGSMAGLGPNPPVIPGQEFSFLGVTDNTNADALDLSGTVLIGAVAIRFPVAGGGPIAWTANFGVQGALVEGTTGGVDTTSKLAISAKDTGITIDPSGTPFVVPDIQNINLTFDAPMVPYVSNGLTYRRPGNLQCGLSFDLLERSLMVPNYQPNVRAIVHVIMNDATFWLLDQVVFGGLANYQVDARTRQIVGYSVNGMWSAVSNLTVDDLGQLKSPDGTDWFGSDPP